MMTFLVSEKSEPFYDEFIEKQLLAGNFPTQSLTVTLVSLTVALPAADHDKLLPGPVVQSSSSSELHTVSSQLSLQSIQEQEVSRCPDKLKTCFILEEIKTTVLLSKKVLSDSSSD